VPPPSPGIPAQLFYTYSHKDEKLREQLETHLSTLKRENRISGWHDRRITAGTEWKGEIDEQLKSSSVILLLVTANFLASDYCHDVELRYAMEQHEQGKARVIPVILRPCDWKTAIFAKLQAFPTDGKPVINWKTRDDAFLNVVEGIRKALDEMDHGASSPAFEKATASAISIPILNALHQLPTPPADFTGRATNSNNCSWQSRPAASPSLACKVWAAWARPLSRSNWPNNLSRITLTRSFISTSRASARNH
jgi:hypothetical protein